ncbi:MAG TPA: peptidoglycan-binding domain-containing protein [Acetobacteraceae bacterium]
MALSYRDAALDPTANPDPALVRALQTDLRALGYLRRTIDGRFGPDTQLAVRRLQHDLLHNTGASTAHDGRAPVAMTAYNRGVTSTTGVVDAALADSIEALLNERDFPHLPRSNDPAAANRSLLATLATTASAVAPTPYLLAIFAQESQCQHYAVPATSGDADSFITLGLDTNPDTPNQVNSRGYGIGQYTLFHHPPRAAEVAAFMADPLRNANAAFAVLRSKFDSFLVGSTAETRADDRASEHPLLALRQCRYGPGDPRFLLACRDCAREARKLDIVPETPVYYRSTETYGQASAYDDPHYTGVPDRADFKCDWPYAVRRYNGSGPNSYNYQARVLLGLLAPPPASGAAA